MTIPTRDSTYFTKKLRYSTALVALLTVATSGAVAVAQSAPGTQAAQANPAQTASGSVEVEEVVVTGTRIIRDGYESPTPVSVLSADDLNVMALPNIANSVNRLPQLQNSVGPQNSGTNVSSGTGGVNHLNLRALSATRTLVLLDGKRVVGSTLAGFENNGSAVDINGFPGGLISRVDVVTGGASAVYGSDALAGVVNFILDKKYTGLKGSVEGGVTTYGDNENYKVSLSGGAPFAGGRGHFLVFAEQTYDRGIKGNNRPWNDVTFDTIANPAYVAGNGLPQYLTQYGVGLANATPGGLILRDNVSGLASPLRGTQFLAGGVPAPFTFGVISPAPTAQLMTGGDWQQSRIDSFPTLALRIERTNFFTRGSYDVTDNVNVYAELSWSDTHAQNFSLVPTFRLGNITIQADNAFIPASIRANMVARGVSNLTMGSTLADGPFIGADNGRTLRRYVAGAEGKFDAFDTGWSWDAFYSRSTTHNSTRAPENLLTANFTRALDSIVSPTTGKITCRVNTDAITTNDAPGCVPYNVFGIGVNAPAALAYVTGTGYAITILSQDVFAASATGEPLSTWAGPVSVAFGVEHRNEKVKGLASALDEARAYFAGNYIATNAKYHVTEGYVETVVPLAKDEEWAKSLELNAAVRGTNYSESGFVTTWKVGATYDPVDDITFRATRSRDIRAPNLGDLFNRGRAGTGVISDPVTNTGVTVVTAITGNPNLKPEKADTTGVGAVYTPNWFPGFAASADFYDISIKGAIVSLSAQQYVDRCFRGVTELCPFIQRNAANVITFVSVQPANVLKQKARGIDFETSYKFPLDSIMSDWQGDVSIRGLANYVFKLTTADNDPVLGLTVINGTGAVDGGGLGIDNGLFTPKFRYTLSLTYDLKPFAATLTARGIGKIKYSPDLVECTSACPLSTLAHPTINNNRIASWTAFDLALKYEVLDGRAEAFFVTQNMFNKAPPDVAGPTDNGYYQGMGNDDYDRIGRTFRVGVRFKM